MVNDAPPPSDPGDVSETETPEAGPPPRAFAQGTGVVLQTVGMIFVLATCCVCSLTFLWDPTPPRGQVDLETSPPSSLAESWQALVADKGKSGLMLTITSLNVGGLALAVFGLGMQSDRRRAAWGALVSVAVLTGVLILAGIWLWSGEAGLQARIWHALALILTLSLWLFLIPAVRQIMANPPPADVDVLPPDYKIPYSVYHDDPPHVRRAREIARRRAQLEAERAELDRMERELEKEQPDE